MAPPVDLVTVGSALFRLTVASQSTWRGGNVVAQAQRGPGPVPLAVQNTTLTLPVTRRPEVGAHVSEREHRSTWVRPENSEFQSTISNEKHALQENFSCLIS